MALWKSGVRVPSGPQERGIALAVARKVGVVAKNKRSVWEELLELGRRILKEIGDLLDPKAPPPRKPAPAPVPIGKRRRQYDGD